MRNRHPSRSALWATVCAALVCAFANVLVAAEPAEPAQTEPPTFLSPRAFVGGAPITAGAPKDAVAFVPPKKIWRRFTILIWQYKTRARQDLELYKKAGFHGFHIDRGHGQDATVAFARKNNLPYYVDHAADKGYLHLTDRTGRRGILRKRGINKRLDCCSCLGINGIFHYAYPLILLPDHQAWKSIVADQNVRPKSEDENRQISLFGKTQGFSNLTCTLRFAEKTSLAADLEIGIGFQMDVFIYFHYLIVRYSVTKSRHHERR